MTLKKKMQSFNTIIRYTVPIYREPTLTIRILDPTDVSKFFLKLRLTKVESITILFKTIKKIKICL